MKWSLRHVHNNHNNQLNNKSMDLTRRTLSENSSMAEEPKMRTAYAEQKLFVNFTFFYITEKLSKNF